MMQLLPILIEAYNKTLDFSNNVMSRFNDEEFAKEVTEMCGHEPKFSELDAQIEIIKNDVDMPNDKKIALLRAVTVQRNAILDRELERKQSYAEIINRGMEKRGEIAIKLVLSVFTGGVSLIPDAISLVKKSLRDDEDQYDDDFYITRK